MNDNRCYISPNLDNEFGNHGVFRVNNTINGNPRYVTHFKAFDDNYDQAKVIANKLGWSVYRAKWFGGGFVTESYNLENDIERIIDARINA